MLSWGFKQVVFVVCILVPQLVFAGYYTVAYSGGTATITNHPRTVSYDYATTYGGTWSEDASPCTVTCSGMVTATFTYHPFNANDLPPVAVFTWQDMVVSYSGSGSCSTGLQNETTNNKTKSADKYTVINDPGQSFSLTVTPQASSTTQLAQGFGANEPASATIQYTCRAYPVNLSYEGIIDDPDESGDNYYCLIGKRAIANIGLGGLDVITPEFTLSPTWSVSGDVFSAFLVGTHTGQRVNVDAADWHDSSPQWVWNRENSCEVSTSTAIYRGSTQVATISLSDDVTVEAPDYFFGGNAAHENTRSGNPLRDTVYSNGNPSVQLEGQVGIKFTGKVHKPSRYSVYGTGSYALCQLCDIHRYDGLRLIQTDGSELDNKFPYDSPGSDNDEDFSCDSDTPSQGFGLNAYYVEDYYDMYMIYLPTPTIPDGEYVPLHVIYWNWKAQPDTGMGDTDVGAGTTITSDGRIYAHPQWTEVFNNQGSSGGGQGGGGSQ